MSRPSADGWDVQLTRLAEKDINRLDPPVKSRVLEALVQLGRDPKNVRSVRKLAGRPESRLRVGDWRVVFDVSLSRQEIYVIRVLPRSSAFFRVLPRSSAWPRIPTLDEHFLAGGRARRRGICRLPGGKASGPCRVRTYDLEIKS
jgi:mRNA interferase RelE/StbE